MTVLGRQNSGVAPQDVSSFPFCDPLWSCILQDYEDDEMDEWTMRDRFDYWRATKEEARRQRKEGKRRRAMERQRKKNGSFSSFGSFSLF